MYDIGIVDPDTGDLRFFSSYDQARGYSSKEAAMEYWAKCDLSKTFGAFVCCAGRKVSDLIPARVYSSPAPRLHLSCDDIVLLDPDGDVLYFESQKAATQYALEHIPPSPVYRILDDECNLISKFSK